MGTACMRSGKTADVPAFLPDSLQGTSQEGTMDEFVYDAFISYSHRDLKWARWLQRRLETFRVPKDLCDGDIPPAHLKVFRDQTDLSGVELQKALQRELEASRFLIVICSPFSAASPWVNDEIRSFQTRGRSGFIIPFIVGGEPESDKPELECFPPALRNHDGKHPLGANAVEIGRNKAFLKLMAVMLNVRFNRLVDREKQRRQKTILISSTAAAVIVAIVASLLWRNAVIKKRNQELSYDIYGAALLSITQDDEFTDEVIENFRTSAEAGNSEAAFYLANCYAEGKGVGENPELAFQWYLTAAEAGYPPAMSAVSECYEQGLGTEADLPKAFEWGLRHAETGDAVAMFNIAVSYEKGIGTGQDPEQAFFWYLRSAEAGYELAIYNTAFCYLLGIGTEENPEQAFYWTEKLAQAGNAFGMFNLGYMYQHGLGTPEDAEQAYTWYRKAAEAGDADGMFMTGWCIENHYGTEDQALEWYRRALENGNEDAAESIARLEAAG